MKNLLIVESPTKVKSIEKFLGNEYKVLASVGHVRDLVATGKKGINVENGTTVKINNISGLPLIGFNENSIINEDIRRKLISWYIHCTATPFATQQLNTFRSVPSSSIRLMY